MSTSSPQSSINNETTTFGSGSRKDPAAGSPSLHGCFHPGNAPVSPRIPRKRSIPRTREDLEDDSNDDQRPILPSPSILITTPPPNFVSSSGDGAGGGHRRISSISRSEIEDGGGDDFTRKNTTNWIAMDEFLTPEGKPEQHQCRKIDVSLYTTKKNVAQGMLDIALLSANCSQLKYLLYHYDSTPATSPTTSPPLTWFGSTSLDLYFMVNFICIALSIFLQIIVGILLILNSRHNVFIHRYQRVADSYSNAILLSVFIVTVVNIFLSVFISVR